MPGTLASTDAGAGPAGATPSWARIAAPISWLFVASWSGRPGAAEAPGAVTISREAETATAAPSRRRHLRGAVIFGCSFRCPRGCAVCRPRRMILLQRVPQRHCSMCCFFVVWGFLFFFVFLGVLVCFVFFGVLLVF